MSGAAYYERLVGKVSRENAVANVDTIVMDELAGHQADRGRFASTMIHAAVCQAILDRRPEYLEEFTNSNPPVLE